MSKKSLRSLNMLLLGFIISISAATGVLYLYGSGQKLPSGLTVSGWKVGGLKLEQFQTELQEQISLLKQQKVKLLSSVPEIVAGQLTLGQLGLTLEDKELAATLQGIFQGSIYDRALHRWRYRSANIELGVHIDSNILAQTIQQTWKDLYNQKPVNAKRHISAADAVEYIPGKSVKRIDASKLQQRLEALIPNIGSLPSDALILQAELAVYEQQPDITMDTLKKEGIERKIIEFTTYFPLDGAGRIHNIRSTASSIHDMVLQPGEIFDYSKIIQQTEAQFGYKEAPVILNGKLVPGIGGGICQVSTTLYNAVLRSGLAIVERRNHSLPISYAPLGQDATYSTGYINFKFRNSTGSHLLIRTMTTDNRIVVKLFGQMPESVSYEIESNILETLEPPVKFVHNPKLRRGKQEKLVSGKAGYIVETYRYKKENGAVVSKELISKDRYSPQPTIIAINSGEPLPEGQEVTPQVIEDGVRGPSF